MHLKAYGYSNKHNSLYIMQVGVNNIYLLLEMHTWACMEKKHQKQWLEEIWILKFDCWHG